MQMRDVNRHHVSLIFQVKIQEERSETRKNLLEPDDFRISETGGLHGCDMAHSLPPPTPPQRILPFIRQPLPLNDQTSSTK